MKPCESYHHGDLPNALRAAAVEVICDRGLGAFSLREVARRAGVSHAAPAHHFTDTRGLLTSLAAEGFQTLTARMLEGRAGFDDAETQLLAIGRAYIDFGVGHPGHAAVMFRSDLVDNDNPEFQLAGLAAFEVLENAVEDLRNTQGSTFDSADATKLCWAAMHGVVQLRAEMATVDEMRGTQSGTAQQAIDRLMLLLLDGLRG